MSFPQILGIYLKVHSLAQDGVLLSRWSLFCLFPPSWTENFWDYREGFVSLVEVPSHFPCSSYLHLTRWLKPWQPFCHHERKARRMAKSTASIFTAFLRTSLICLSHFDLGCPLKALSNWHSIPLTWPEISIRLVYLEYTCIMMFTIFWLPHLLR